MCAMPYGVSFPLRIFPDSFCSLQKAIYDLDSVKNTITPIAFTML